jgi:multidrug resistance efflux pump
MTWANRIRLVFGLIVVVAVVGTFTLVLNQRQTQVASDTASIEAISYPVGADYAGTVTSQAVEEGDEVTKGDPLLTIQSASLLTAINGPVAVPKSPAYVADSSGELTLIATEDGVVSELDATTGGFVGAGQTLATIDQAGSLYVLAEFTLDPYDFSRLEEGAVVELVLPDHQRIVGFVSVVSVETVKGEANIEVEIKSDELVQGTHNGLVEPGTPVTAIMHLRDDGPFAGIKDTLQSLREQVGL